MRPAPSNLALVFALGLAVGCGVLFAGRFPARFEAEVTGPPDQVPWTNLQPLVDPDEFRFVVVTDRTGEHRDGVFEGAMGKINLLRPEFVVSVGDLIEGYSEDRAVLDREWNEIEGFVGRLGMPFFYVPGNHDMSNAVMAEAWQSRFGPSYYHFSYKGVLFLALNSELFGMVHDPKSPVPGPWTQADQMAFVERVLSESRGARWTFVLVHQPLWDSPRPNPDWLRVEALLADRPHTVFAGHFHRYTQHRRGAREYITLATTGGGSRMRGTPWGEFDHVAQVSMTAGGPVIANLRLDGILPSDVVTSELRELTRQLETAVVAEPMLSQGRYFSRGTARFSVANPSAQPLRVSARYLASRDLVPERVDERVEVEPGGVATLEAPLGVRASRGFESLAPARAQFTLETLSPDGEPLRLERELAILPERRFDAVRAVGRVKVDGDLSEWGRLPFVVDEPGERSGHGIHRGPEDGSFRFGVSHDREFLYVAVDVRDDSIVASPDEVAREQDHVSLSIDARPDPERSRNEATFVAIRNGSMAKLVSPLVALGETRPDPILKLFAGGVPEGVLQAVRRTEPGYAVEVAVPVAVLDERRGERWDALRLNVTLSDFDEGEPDHVDLSWRPSRFEAGAIEGAGTFLRR
jgi:3',5'-cyclic AMP phosphodiesterase CpdA